MIEIRCDWCDDELQEPGALMFSPPKHDSWEVMKTHLCVKCYDLVMRVITEVHERVGELKAENQPLREELRSEQMERSDAEREADRLRFEVELLTEAVNTECVTCIALCAGIEKLRDDVLDVHPNEPDTVSVPWVARRLIELLEHGDET